MKKLAKFLSMSLLACSIVGCSCKKETVVESTLENPAQVMNGSKTSITLSTQDIYKYVRENDPTSVNTTFLTYLMEHILNFSNSDDGEEKTITYNIKIKEYFQENFLDVDTYKVNGVFNEDLLVADLETKLFIIDKKNTPTEGPTKELNLKYDYSDFIKRGLNYNVYLEMLKEEYILEERPNLLNNSKTRIISVFSTDDLEEMETIVDELFEGKYATLEDVSKTKKEEEKKEIGRQFCVNLGLEDGDYYDGACSPSTSSSTYDSALYKFTVCENGVRCTPYDGLKHQIKLIEDTEYVTEQVINKNTSDVLYEKALQQLLRNDVEDYLHKVIDGQDYFLVNGLYNGDEEFNKRDIILSTGPNGTHYLVTVRVVDEETTNPIDKERALSLLLDRVSETTVLVHYLEGLTVEIEDPAIKEYYNTLTGK